MKVLNLAFIFYNNFGLIINVVTLLHLCFINFRNVSFTIVNYYVLLVLATCIHTHTVEPCESKSMKQ